MSKQVEKFIGVQNWTYTFKDYLGNFPFSFYFNVFVFLFDKMFLLLMKGVFLVYYNMFFNLI